MQHTQKRQPAWKAEAALLWGTPKARHRGPRPSITVGQVVEAGIALADAQGLVAVSMERVAQKLGVTTMALYRHVPGKAELVALMIEHGLGQPPAPSGRSWRRQLLRWANALLALFLRHPWSLEATARLRVMGPRELAWLEAGMRVLEPTGLRPAECHGACLALVSQVRTTAQFSMAQRHALSGPGWAAATRKVIAGRAEYRCLQAMLDQPAARGLEQGLAWVLDGVEARLTRGRRR